MKKFILFAVVLIFGGLDSPKLSMAQEWVQTNGAEGICGGTSAILCFPPNKLFLACESQIWRREDTLSDWKLVFKFNSHSSGSTFHWLGIDSNRNIFANCDSTLLLSRDSGLTWQQFQLFNDDIASALVTRHYIFVSVGGYFYRANQNEAWDIARKDIVWSPLLGYYGQSFAIDSSGIIYLGEYNMVSKSLDEGNSWQSYWVDPVHGNSYKDVIGPMTIDVYGNILVNVWMKGIYRSSDYCQSWISFNNGLPNPSSTSSRVRSLLKTPSGVIFALADSIYMLDPGACRWVPYSDGLRLTGSDASLTVDSEGKIFVAGGYLFESTNTFDRVLPHSGLVNANDINFGSITIDDTICSNVVIKNVGLSPMTLTKSFFVLDPIPFSVDPSFDSLLPLVLDPKDSVSATVCFHPYQPGVYGSEIDWKTDANDSTCLVEKSQSFLHGIAFEKSSVRSFRSELQFSASPNPFIKETTLEFTLYRVAYVTFAVYDDLGRLVWGDGKGSSLEAGTHAIHLDGRSLPGGTLYARIATGFGEVKTVKLVHE